jgi:hypothetical protein
MDMRHATGQGQLLSSGGGGHMDGDWPAMKQASEQSLKRNQQAPNSRSATSLGQRLAV